MKAICIFTRNLRLNDNPILDGFSEYEIIPVFLVDYLEGFERDSNLRKYFLKVLKNFSRSLFEAGSHLYVISKEDFAELLEKTKADEVRMQFDVDRVSQALFSEIKQACLKKAVKFTLINDFLTNYSKPCGFANFRQFFAKKFLVDTSFPIKVYKRPERINTGTFAVREIVLKEEEEDFSFPYSEESAVEAFENFVKNKLNNYEKLRDFPSRDSTSRASVLLRVGLVSYRHVFLEGKKSPKFVSEIAWSEFNRHVAFKFREIDNGEIKESWRGFPWQQNEKLFELWSEGKTGYPLVDAGMRELKHTGFMHNRVRLVVASFLTKNLLIDWRRGERLFRRFLLDYDYAENAGNWQWVAGCGMDAAPYFRVFNPVLQAAKYDPECEYIRRFLPELEKEPCKNILNANFRKGAYFEKAVELKSSRNTYIQIASYYLRQRPK